MSEEMKKPEVEISEAELTNVSGGSLEYYHGETEVRHYLCNPCPGSKHPSKCSGSAAEVVAYMRQTQRAIDGPGKCPFFKR